MRLRTDASYERQERIGYHASSAALTLLKQQPETTWLNDGSSGSSGSSVPLQQALRHLAKAFRDVFEGRTKYPAFKQTQGRQSAEYTTSAFRWHAETRTLTLAKRDAPLAIRWSRDFPGAPSTITLAKDSAGRSFVAFLVEEAIEVLPVVPTRGGEGKMWGCTTSPCSVPVNRSLPRGTCSAARARWRKVAHAQRTLARKQKGSKNREKARLKVARAPAKMADQRADGLHKLTTRVIRANHVLCVESLRVKNLVRHHTLANAISDAGWGELVKQLQYKARWYGRTVVASDTWYPRSKRCSACGYSLGSLDLATRQWTGPACGARHARDINAAKHVLAAGLAVNACGEAVRPGRATPDSARPAEAGIPRL